MFGHSLTIHTSSISPSPQPSPARGEGDHCKRHEMAPLQKKGKGNAPERGVTTFLLTVDTRVATVQARSGYHPGPGIERLRTCV